MLKGNELVRLDVLSLTVSVRRLNPFNLVAEDDSGHRPDRGKRCCERERQSPNPVTAASTSLVIPCSSSISGVVSFNARSL